LIATVAAMLATAVHADVSLRAGRLGAKDVPALAKFYEAAFGLREIGRFEMPNVFEIMMNVGATVDEAKANKAPLIILMRRDSDAIQDPVPHLLLSVTDIKAIAAAVKAAGGSMEEPRPFGKSGMLLGFATDPAGNRIELIQEAKH
jgi:predicted enzyme related to lactoylglutathione lyase